MIRFGLYAYLIGMLAVALAAAESARAEPPVRFEGRPTLTFVYETIANPPRYLGTGTAINWDRPGLSLDLLRELGSRLRINLEIQRFPWNRGLFLVETGEADGIFHASYKPARERIGVYPKTPGGTVDPSRAVFTQSYYLHVLRGSSVRWDGKTVTGLEDKAVGATAGYSIVQDLESWGIPVETGKIQQTNLNKLVAGRIAAYAELENMAAAVIASDPAAYLDVIRLDPPLISKPYYLLLSHAFVESDPALAQAVFDTIAAINADPVFQARAAAYATAEPSR